MLAFRTRIVTICCTQAFIEIQIDEPLTSVEGVDQPVVVEALEEPRGRQGPDVAHVVLELGFSVCSLL